MDIDASLNMQKLIQEQLKRMDEDRDNARIEQKVRLQRIEDTVNQIQANTAKIFVWLTGNGNPEAGLLHKTNHIEDLITKHLEDCGAEGISNQLKRIDALENTNKQREEKGRDLKAKIYDLVKPLLSDFVRTLIILIVMILIFALTGQEILTQILLLIS